MMPSAACGPCRERRLRCDLRVPHCSNCTRGRRACPGYNVQRLSWPKPNNKKRALLGPEPRESSHGHASRIRPSRWANVGVQDIGAHHYLSSLDSIRGKRLKLIQPPLTFTTGLSWMPTRLDASRHTLLQYFHLIAAEALICEAGSQLLVGILMRLAFRDDSALSQAVLYSTLAVSSLLRHGPDMESIGLQGAALRSLEKSAKAGITGSTVVQHVAAGMLLCCFEIHGNFQASGPWFLYVTGAKQLVRAVSLDRHTIPSEFIEMTDWLYHYDVSAQFALKHWKRRDIWPMAEDADHPKQVAMRQNTMAMTDIVKTITKLTGDTTPPHSILWPLADVFQNILDSSHPQYHSVKYRRELEALEHELESIGNGRHVGEENRPSDLTVLDSEGRRQAAVIELYRLAALIYLERASNSFSGRSTKLDAWASAAFDLLELLGVCRYGFPVFIIACEARDDEQRIIILDCLDKTQEMLPTAGMQIVKDMIQSAWTLEDLETERELEYMAKLDVVISGCKTMPSFA